MKTKKIFLMAALALTFAACSNDDRSALSLDPVKNDIQNPAQPAKAEGITITATLAPKSNGAATRVVSPGTDKIVASWAANEHIAILYTVGSEKKVADAEIKSVDASGTATIEFAVVTGTADNTVCTLVYPYSAAKDDKSGVKAYADLLATQDGTLSDNLDVRVGAGTIQTTTPSLTVTTQPAAQFAIFKFTLSGVSIDNTHPLVIKDNASNTTITTVTPASTATSVYVAMPAAASKAYKFVVTTAENKYIKSGTAAIDAGKYYQTTLSMSPRYPLALSSVTIDDLGAVACSDGLMYMEKKATPDGKTAVGILGNVTETGHGLILALKDATSQTWSTINGWTSTTAYAETTLKLLPDDAARGANLTSYTKLGETTVSDWAVAQKSDYEAIFTNLGSKQSDSEGTTYDDNVNAYITTGVGGAAISGENWSATEISSDYAWDFLSTSWYRPNKIFSNSVRPVLCF